MKCVTTRLRSFTSSGLRGQLIRGGLGSIAIRVANLALEMCVAVVLARLMGAHGYGEYAYAYALMRTLAIPAQAGLPTLAVREVAAYTATSNWALLKGLLRRMNQVAIFFSLAVAILAVTVAATWGSSAIFIKNATFVWAMVLLPLMALGNIRGAVLRGLHLVVQGQLPENVLRPAFFLLLVGGAFVFTPKHGLTPELGMALHAAGAGIAFGIGAWLLLKHLPEQVFESTPAYDTKRWVLSAIPLSMIMGMMVINNQAAILILGFFHTPADVGVYGVVSQVALVVTVPVTAVNLAVGPHIAKLHAHGDQVHLQLVATWSARFILVMGLVAGGSLILVGPKLLELGFGTEFSRGYIALAILCVGQCLSAFMGASMIVLNMTRNERQVAHAFLLSMLANVLGNLLLTPKYGLVGAATSVAISVILLNGMLALQVRRHLRLNPFAVGGWPPVSGGEYVR